MEKTLIDRLFCLNEDEFILLAGSCGIRELHGFEIRNNEKCELNEERIKMSIFSLCKKEVLSSSEYGFKIASDVKSIFQSIKDAKHVIDIEYTDEEQAPVCIYVGDGPIAYVRPAANGVDYVQLGAGNDKSLSAFLEDSELLPEGIKDEEMDSLWESIEDRIMVPEQDIESLPNRFVLVKVKDPVSKEMIAKAAVIRNENGMICLKDSRTFGRSIKRYHKSAFIESICDECRRIGLREV
jgi:hypothetical protein